MMQVGAWAVTVIKPDGVIHGLYLQFRMDNSKFINGLASIIYRHPVCGEDFRLIGPVVLGKGSGEAGLDVEGLISSRKDDGNDRGVEISDSQ
jgi:hypothetical protein